LSLHADTCGGLFSKFSCRDECHERPIYFFVSPTGFAGPLALGDPPGLACGIAGFAALYVFVSPGITSLDSERVAFVFAGGLSVVFVSF
jgi:hypothetical protein